MKKGKYKILVIPSDRTGVSKFRSVDPHVNLQKMYPEDFWVDVDYNPNLEDDDFLKKYDLVHYHRCLSPDGNGDRSNKVVENLKKLGIPSIMDLDDYWLPTIDHPAHAIVKQNNLDKQIRTSLVNAHHVTTTTKVFASEIALLNKNVHVLPNSINPNERQFKPKKIESDRVRIGWLGGSSHIKDLQILDGLAGKLHASHKDKFQFVLCGFDLRGQMTMINPETNEQTNRAIEPHESVWYNYEQIVTGKYNTVSKEYHEFLMKWKKEEYPNVEDTSYRRVWTKPVTTYASNYNHMDISLAPLKEHIFNRVKSQLKVIEAGFHKKALIAQDYGPYQIDCINAIEYGGKINPKGNALLVNTHKNHKQWHQYVKKLMDNPSLVEDLGERLYETVAPLYHIDIVTANRAELYKELIRKS
tara:strand:- start:5094 stop:6335 length:1242 start_codon:yes stop_codon:yes gene_type:complete